MRKKQLLLSFPAEEHRTAPDPAAQQRRCVAEVTEGQRGPRRKIQHLVQSGIAADKAGADERLLALAINRLRRGLREFVDHLATGEFARDQRHQDEAVTLRRSFDTLPEAELALKLKELGLCESTKSFRRPLGSFRYVLFEFRRAMQRHAPVTSFTSSSSHE